ncbi:MAG TPA: hypothetical protein ENG03_07190 [Thioploca sp.]|nr:MAG: hypothetical protein DRR19_02680 [Gammaproteobacteria bacterium]HDN26868.1 hypothetical protein [Thioploca sp.]
MRQIDLGISLGTPLSPLMGGVYLKPLDDAMTETGWFYARFMDDWVVLAPSRGPLRFDPLPPIRFFNSLKNKTNY